MNYSLVSSLKFPSCRWGLNIFLSFSNSYRSKQKLVLAPPPNVHGSHPSSGAGDQEWAFLYYLNDSPDIVMTWAFQWPMDSINTFMNSEPDFLWHCRKWITLNFRVDEIILQKIHGNLLCRRNSCRREQAKKKRKKVFGEITWKWKKKFVKLRLHFSLSGWMGFSFFKSTPICLWFGLKSSVNEW